MNADDKEKKLLGLLAPRRSEAFWAGRRAEIVSSARRRPLGRLVMVPALGVAVALLIVLLHPRKEAPDRAVVSAAFLENLDMLDDMDVLEAVPEDRL